MFQLISVLSFTFLIPYKSGVYANMQGYLHERQTTYKKGKQ